jgi:hypothetical protein
MIRPRLASTWYATDALGAPSTVNAVAGSLWAVPFMVTTPNERYDTWGIETTGAIAGTAVRAGIYDDVAQDGYPQFLVSEFTSAGAFTITNTAAVKTQAMPAFQFYPNPGLYWLVIKYTTAGVTHPFRHVNGPSLLMPNTSTGGSVNGSQFVGYTLTGQGTTAFPTIFPAGAVGATTAPALTLKRAA